MFNSDVTLANIGFEAVLKHAPIARIIDVFEAIGACFNSPQSHTQPRAKKSVSAILAIMQHDM
jgi:hypothetical protein